MGYDLHYSIVLQEKNFIFVNLSIKKPNKRNPLTNSGQNLQLLSTEQSYVQNNVKSFIINQVCFISYQLIVPTMIQL